MQQTKNNWPKGELQSGRGNILYLNILAHPMTFTISSILRIDRTHSVASVIIEDDTKSGWKTSSVAISDTPALKIVFS